MLDDLEWFRIEGLRLGFGGRFRPSMRNDTRNPKPLFVAVAVVVVLLLSQQLAPVAEQFRQIHKTSHSLQRMVAYKENLRNPCKSHQKNDMVAAAFFHMTASECHPIPGFVGSHFLEIESARLVVLR